MHDSKLLVVIFIVMGLITLLGSSVLGNEESSTKAIPKFHKPVFQTTYDKVPGKGNYIWKITEAQKCPKSVFIHFYLTQYRRNLKYCEFLHLRTLMSVQTNEELIGKIFRLNYISRKLYDPVASDPIDMLNKMKSLKGYSLDDEYENYWRIAKIDGSMIYLDICNYSFKKYAHVWKIYQTAFKDIFKIKDIQKELKNKFFASTLSGFRRSHRMIENLRLEYESDWNYIPPTKEELFNLAVRSLVKFEVPDYLSKYDMNTLSDHHHDIYRYELDKLKSAVEERSSGTVRIIQVVKNSVEDEESFGRVVRGPQTCWRLEKGKEVFRIRLGPYPTLYWDAKK